MSDLSTQARPVVTLENFLAATEPTAADAHFGAHRHATDQLAWVQGGGMRVRVDDSQWRVTHSQFVWIPAGSEHEMWMEGADGVLSLYLDPSLRPDGERWRRPLVLPVHDLAGSVIRHLCAQEQDLSRRQVGMALVRDILEHTVESADVLAMPEHPAARRVAEALIDDPSSQRTLEHWALEAGVSSKTLLRSFVSDTGATFTQWRTRARMYRAAQLLNRGWSVQDVAGDVGYTTPTGFIKAYRGVYNATPAAHTARLRRTVGPTSN